MRVFCVVGFKDGFCGTLNKTHSHIGRYTHTHTYGIQQLPRIMIQRIRIFPPPS